MSNVIQRHPFHLVDPSPWPFLAAISALTTTTGFVMYMHCYLGGFYLGFIGFLSLVNVSFFWVERHCSRWNFSVVSYKSGSIWTTLGYAFIHIIRGYVFLCFFLGFFCF